MPAIINENASFLDNEHMPAIRNGTTIGNALLSQKKERQRIVDNTPAKGRKSPPLSRHPLPLRPGTGRLEVSTKPGMFPMPSSTELLRDIHETNLMYLLLLQRLARTGDASAISGLQISEQACQWLASRQYEDLVKMARCSVMLAQLNLESELLLSALSHGMDATLAANALGVPATQTAPPERQPLNQP
ncbi:flagellar transcriptional regulator FlhD [Achromobacter seleniivolatilans]|uniref:Flagellar transcriptional regulator FlhD n=1 Tax=Achromobacter seleniivolatilans TaxID=3047478 RepID=A0ABY9M5W2_9BURK|nr:flagellar transcriptional regulator FlhD [Achromobacter sp. R39]WMD22008.1 flagellar transcriptional regulator FlhD [Achromobacter sp. R39]